MIKVITGPMFSGKSDLLLEEYDKKYHKSKILLFKPKLDTRDYGVTKSRNGKEISSILITDVKDIKNYINEKISTIFIDEANLLKGNAKELLNISIMDDIDIYVAGLNLTSEQEPFGIMPYLISIADELVIKTASCKDCNRDAIYTYYDGPKKGAILIGNDNYMSLCSGCLRKRIEKNECKK